MNTWFQQLRDTGFHIPESYIVFDVETTGRKPDWDYIVQFGHMVVAGGVPRTPLATILNWPCCPSIMQGDLRQKSIEIEHLINEHGYPYRFQYEILSNEGVDPVAVLEVYYELFKGHQDDGGYFVTHNGVRFDTQIVAGHFKRFLGHDFTFNNDQMIDTGLLEKAAQLGMLPLQNESLTAYWNRVESIIAPGVKWSLDRHCIPKYSLAEQHKLDISQSHTADFDCLVTHLLLEEFRDLSLGTDICNGKSSERLGIRAHDMHDVVEMVDQRHA